MRIFIKLILFLLTSASAVAQGKYSSIKPYCDGIAIAHYRTGSATCLDITGKEILGKYRDIKHISEGLIVVKNESGKWGFIDKSGKLVIDYQYEDAGGFHEGLSWVKKFGKYGFVDKDNELVILFHYSKEPGNFSEGLAAVPDIGYINKDGETVLDFKGMKNGNPFNGGFSGVQLNDGKWILIDKSGKQSGKDKYDDLKPFSEGMAAALPDASMYVYGYINTKGEQVIKPLHLYAGDFKNGVANVSLLKTWYLIDKTNKAVLENTSEKANYSDGLIARSFLGKLGYTNLKGEMEIPFIFSEAGNFSEGRAVVKIDEIYGIINKEGVPITEDIMKPIKVILQKLNSEGEEIVWADSKTYEYNTFCLASTGGVTFKLRRKGKVEDTSDPTKALVSISGTEILDPAVKPNHYEQLKARLLKDLEKEDAILSLFYEDFYFADADKNEPLEERLAEYPGGEQALWQFISRNVKYPAMTAEKGIQGRVIVEFIIDATGKTQNPVIIRSVDPLLDAEAKRVVLSLPTWKPATINGKPVDCKYVIPFTFSLN